MGEEWYETHWTKRKIDQASDRYEGYQSRKQAHVHKLAMVLAASQRDELTIELDDLVAAELKLSEVEGNMAKVFAAIGASTTSKNVTSLMAFVRTYKKISYRQLWRFCFPIMSTREFDEALDGVIRAGFVQLTSEDGVKFVILKGKKEKEKSK